jgi:nitrogen fixation/metabolism regulation signal transduction histidine kinase
MDICVNIFDPDVQETCFLPAPRAKTEELEAQCSIISKIDAPTTLELLPLAVYILNDRRQIVWLNKKAREAIQGDQALGLRPGEALGCANSHITAGGCGTSPLCTFCGTPSAIVRAIEGAEGADECFIHRHDNLGLDALNLLVWTAPLDKDDHRFILMTTTDISSRKRHEVLERLFHHDIGNTVTGIQAMLDILQHPEDDPGTDYLSLLKSAADQLADEIASQRVLRAVEEGSLASEPSWTQLEAVVDQTIALFRYPLYGRGIVIEKVADTAWPAILTDEVLLRRIMVNMFKNAVEASGRGDVIRIGFRAEGDDLVLWVWNPAVLGEETKRRMFERSYSTKGRGRGLGTYGMKLSAERYLGGRVHFDSAPGEGTRFELWLPRTPEKSF